MTRKHPLIVALAALLVLPMAAVAQSSIAASPQPAAKAGPVTIEGTQERRALRLKVDQFVTSVVVKRGNESLVRWNQPICPLVAGLPRDYGEFVLARVSQAARDAHAPLAGSNCRANLFVVATAHPDRVLKKWLSRDPQVETRHGIEPVDSLLASAQPVRVWYNTVASCDGVMASGSQAAAGLSALSEDGSPGSLGPSFCQNGIDTQLNYGDVRSLYSAVVIIDTNQLTHVTIGQLADYVSLVGLVSVRPDTDGEGAPTILRLFRDADAPQGLTPWDEALLYSLYNTDQSGKLQLINMESVMVGRITQ